MCACERCVIGKVMLRVGGVCKGVAVMVRVWKGVVGKDERCSVHSESIVRLSQRKL